MKYVFTIPTYNIFICLLQMFILIYLHIRKHTVQTEDLIHLKLNNKCTYFRADIVYYMKK